MGLRSRLKQEINMRRCREFNLEQERLGKGIRMMPYLSVTTGISVNGVFHQTYFPKRNNFINRLRKKAKVYELRKANRIFTFRCIS